MTKSILVPMDSSCISKNALKYAFSEYPNAEFTVFHVLSTKESIGYGESIESIRTCNELAHEETERLFDEARILAEEYDVSVSTVMQSGPTSRTIIDYSKSQDINQVVMGCNGRSGIKRLLLGSVTEVTVRNTSVPITIVPNGSNQPKGALSRRTLSRISGRGDD